MESKELPYRNGSGHEGTENAPALEALNRDGGGTTLGAPAAGGTAITPRKPGVNRAGVCRSRLARGGAFPARFCGGAAEVRARSH